MLGKSLITYELVHGQEIRLGEGVFNLEYFREIVDCAVRTLQGEASLVFEAPRGVDSNRNTPALVLTLGHGFNVFKVTYGPG